jgi:hypothetical protein
MVKGEEGVLTAQKAEQALKRAVKGVVAERKLRGQPLIVWQNGKVVKIPAKRLR